MTIFKGNIRDTLFQKLNMNLDMNEEIKKITNSFSDHLIYLFNEKKNQTVHSLEKFIEKKLKHSAEYKISHVPLKLLKKYSRIMPYKYSNEDLNELVMKMDKLMPKFGTIEQLDKGMVYVKISEAFVKYLQPLLNQRDYSSPPSYGERDVGAHISVITGREVNEKDIKIDNLLGIKPHLKKVLFSITSFRIVKPVKWGNVKKAAIVEIQCPELREIRKSCGLSENHYHGGNFHITVAVKFNKNQTRHNSIYVPPGN